MPLRLNYYTTKKTHLVNNVSFFILSISLGEHLRASFSPIRLSLFFSRRSFEDWLLPPPRRCIRTRFMKRVIPLKTIAPWRMLKVGEGHLGTVDVDAMFVSVNFLALNRKLLFLLNFKYPV